MWTPRSRISSNAGLLDVGHALVDAAERAALEQVRRVNGVAGRPQLVGEGADAGRQPLSVVEQQDLGHVTPRSISVGFANLSLHRPTSG